jgi:hypothetical protein
MSKFILLQSITSVLNIERLPTIPNHQHHQPQKYQKKSFKMRRIIQYKLTRRNNRRRIKSIKTLSPPLPAEKQSAEDPIRMARRHPLRSGLKQRPSTLAYGSQFAFDGEEQGSAAGYEGRSHGRARLKAEGTLCGR